MEREDSNVHNFDKRLILVEYPGVVENEERAIRTLGGLHNISTVRDRARSSVNTIAHDMSAHSKNDTACVKACVLTFTAFHLNLLPVYLMNLLVFCFCI
jgi:hypothetical protein